MMPLLEPVPRWSTVVAVSPMRMVTSLSGTQGLSRTLHEAVQFNAHEVLSRDWVTCPILNRTEAPGRVDIVILNNRPGGKSWGAGEPATRPVAAVIANALFDATGVRVRTWPLRGGRIYPHGWDRLNSRDF